MSRNEVPLPYTRWTLLAWGVLSALGNCWLSCTVDRRSTVILAPFTTWHGFIAGQTAWIAICSVLANWSLLQRGLYCVIATLAMVLSCTVAEWCRVPFFWWKMPFRELLVLPVVVLAIQSPFWALRTWAGWRFVQPANGASEDKAPPLGVHDLLGAATCVALVSCAIGLYVSPSVLPQLVMDCVDASVMFAMTSLFAAVPAAALVLQPSRAGTAVCVTALYQVCLFVVSYEVLYLLSVPLTHMAIHVMNFAAVFFLTLDFPLFVVRGLGWRLQWR